MHNRFRVVSPQLVRLLSNLKLDDYFWQYQSAGVAIFIAHGQVTAVGLHDAPAEHAAVSEHFYLTPIALDAAGKKSYRVLASCYLCDSASK